MEKRNIDLGVKINTAEEKQILAKAKLLGMNKSDYVRFVVLNSKISVDNSS